MRPTLPILALCALVIAPSAAQASPEAWRKLDQRLQEESVEDRRVELVQDAWKNLGPRSKMRTIERLGKDAGDPTERFLVERLEKERNAFLRRRLALVLGRFATRGDTLEALELLAATDAVSKVDTGRGCSAGTGHARDEARLAGERVRERRSLLLDFRDNSTISITPAVGVSWFGTTTP